MNTSSSGKVTPGLLVIILLLCAAFPSQGLSGGSPAIRVLSNGMTVILQENPGVPVVSIQAWVEVGSADENADEAGMAHVLEHMLFKGTTTRGVGTIAKEVEAAGGEINAYTSWQRTVYYINMSSRFMDRGIDILADIMQNAAFDPEELAKEKKVILEEIRRSKDMPARRMSRAFFAEAFTVHPYGKPVIGFEDSVQSFARENVLAFYKKWYVPENMVWTMAGDFDTHELMPVLEERLSRISKSKMPVRDLMVEPPQTAPQSFVLEEDVSEAHLRIGFHIPSITNPDVPALDLLAQILGQGKSSRLYQTLRMQKRLVNSVFAYSMTPKDPGLFTVGSSLEPEDMAEALSGILKQVLLIASEPVTAEELARAKAQIESDFIYEKETVQGQARELGYYQTVLRDLEFGDKYLAQLQLVRASDLLRVARTYLRPDNLTVGSMVPASAQKTIDEKGLLKFVTDAYNDLRVQQEKQGVRAGSRAGKVVKTRLSNNACLLVKNNPAVPLVSFRAVFLGGLRTESPQTSGISNFTASMLTKGTSSRTEEEIAKAIESMAGSVSGFSGRDSVGLSASVVSWNFQPAFEIFADILLHPEFPEEHLEKKRQDILKAIKNQEDNLPRLAFRQFWEGLYPCQPYGMDIMGTTETIKAMTREDLVGYFKKQVVGPNLVLAIVGDIGDLKVEELSEQLIGQLPDKPYDPDILICDDPPRHEAVRKVSPDKLQAHLVVGARGCAFSNRDRYRLEVLQAVLSGQGGQLFLNLRDQQSLAYTVMAFNRDAYEPGSFGVYLATKPQNYQKALQEIRKQLAAMGEERISGEELDRAKNFILGTYDLGLQTNSAQAASLASYERYGLGCLHYEQYPERIKAVTANQVRKAARKYLSSQDLVQSIILPEEKEKADPEGDQD